jgi:small GTP-binding protein
MIEDIVYKVHLWDTAGQEVYHSITAPYFRNAAGVLLFFDLSDRSTFQALDYWFNLIDENTRAMPLVNVLGNKCDLPDRQTSIVEAREYCQQKGALYFEVSAKTGENAEHALVSLVEQIAEKQNVMPVSVPPPMLVRQEDKRGTCCS